MKASFPPSTFPAKGGAGSFPAVACVALLFLAAGSARAALNHESPFLPAPGTAAATQEAGALELRGVAIFDGEPIFNLMETSTKKGAWVKLNQTGREFVVKSHELATGNDVVNVEYQGRLMRLPLKQAKTGKSSGSPLPQGAAALVAGARPGPPPPQQAQGPISRVVLNPTPADEARRMEDFRNEVFRRRSLRQQSSQPQQQGQQQQAPARPQQ